LDIPARGTQEITVRDLSSTSTAVGIGIYNMCGQPPIACRTASGFVSYTHANCDDVVEIVRVVANLHPTHDYEIRMPCPGTGTTGTLAAGWQHTLVLKGNGKVAGWGLGVLGFGDSANKTAPIALLSDETTAAVAVAAYQYWGMVAMADGTLRTFGDNIEGKLCDGTTSPRTLPIIAKNQNGTNLIVDARPGAIACGERFGAAVTTESKVVTWGLKRWGALGDADPASITFFAEPRLYPAPVKKYDGTDLIGAVDLTCGQDYALARMNDGRVFGWGYNGAGTLSIGNAVSTGTAQIAKISSSVELTNVTAISGGATHAYALRSDGTVWAWGGNNKGQLADGTTITRLYAQPVKLNATTTLTDVAAVYAGHVSGMALLSSGTLLAWGDNENGQCGLDPAVYGTVITYPTPVSLPPGIVITNADAGGALFGQCFAADGTRYGWGWNLSGAVGDCSTTARPTPVVGISLP
jgi:alpha-tubulin suppressor-like RCC1 family protein